MADILDVAYRQWSMDIGGFPALHIQCQREAKSPLSDGRQNCDISCLADEAPPAMCRRFLGRRAQAARRAALNRAGVIWLGGPIVALARGPPLSRPDPIQ